MERRATTHPRFASAAMRVPVFPNFSSSTKANATVSRNKKPEAYDFVKPQSPLFVLHRERLHNAQRAANHRPGHANIPSAGAPK
jgi:hypothetical protein